MVVPIKSSALSAAIVSMSFKSSLEYWDRLIPFRYRLTNFSGVKIGSILFNSSLLSTAPTG